MRHRDLSHPLPLLAVGVLLLNDHVLKGSGLLPASITGKLSDVAGLFFFPILLSSAALWLTPARRRAGARRLWMVLAVAATGLVFSLLKVSPVFNAIACEWWGQIVLDPTDLLALPMLGLSLLFLESRAPEGPAPRWFQALTVLAASAASVATPAPRQVRAYPTWELNGSSEQFIRCASVRPFIARSGKQGVGVGFEVVGSAGCQVTAAARVLIEGQTFEIAGPPAVVDPSPSELRYLYVPILFDNEASWNDGVRAAELELDVTAGGEPRRWRVPMTHRFDGYFEDRHARPLPSGVSTPPRPPGSPPPPTPPPSPPSGTSGPPGRFATPPGAP